MLTPHDKLTAGVNDIIQIVVTTSCDIFTCSNCTQLLPFRKDYRHMTLACFLKAVKSLSGWPGIVALFGGNPCSHPQFPELCRILEDYFPQKQRGLWSNNLLGHGAIVRKTFYPDGRFNLNVHKNIQAAIEMGEWVPSRVIRESVRMPSVHAPILVSHKDLGISYEDWVDLREACPINQRWSAAIVEGREGGPLAYFCEVAAALDGVRGDSHGVPVFPGWWKAPIERFGVQIQGCCDQGCGVPLQLEGQLDSDKTYIVSQSFIPYTALKTPVVHVRTVESPTQTPSELTDYLRLRS
jgi:hypothetical protein